LGLPKSEKALAFKILAKSGLHIPSIPTNQVQLALKVFNRLKRGVDIAIKSGSIGI
jgi:transposase